jgi:hypothetical protein
VGAIASERVREVTAKDSAELVDLRPGGSARNAVGVQPKSGLSRSGRGLTSTTA